MKEKYCATTKNGRTERRNRRRVRQPTSTTDDGCAHRHHHLSCGQARTYHQCRKLGRERHRANRATHFQWLCDSVRKSQKGEGKENDGKARAAVSSAGSGTTSTTCVLHCSSAADVQLIPVNRFHDIRSTMLKSLCAGACARDSHVVEHNKQQTEELQRHSGLFHGRHNGRLL